MRLKRLFISLFIVCLFCCRAHGQQQDTSVLINIQLDSASIEKFAGEIEKQSGFHFYFDSTKVDSIAITVTIKNQPLKKALDLALVNTDVYYTFDNANHIFLTKG